MSIFDTLTFILEIDSMECLGRLSRAVSGDDTSTVDNNWDSEFYTEVFAWGSNHAG